ncbi:MAG TPA: class I SAM-dependent methyltransferase [candidate division Zixibacteria bacterium]|nr:class I SAM-dependent methyltransferase [candidate division Zixibacteria bacterium]HEQ98095.1 class I SAM-dependent methyltransferase [candidate division Zixibacteria bacterium]
MDSLEDRLAQIDGRILDVAAGRGASLKYLVDKVGEFEQAVGVDFSEQNLNQAKNQFDDNRIIFLKMRAEELDFDDNQFDLVAIVNSLHHLDNPQKSLEEMHRVLKPGGLLLVSEMYNDNQSERQRSHVLLHHWWADVDRISGIPHYHTFPRQRIIDMIRNLNLAEIQIMEYEEDKDLSGDKETMSFLIDATDNYLSRIMGKPEHRSLYQTGLELKERLATTGISWAKGIAIWGEKTLTR